MFPFSVLVNKKRKYAGAGFSPGDILISGVAPGSEEGVAAGLPRHLSTATIDLMAT
jgi:hypothetical protein